MLADTSDDSCFCLTSTTGLIRPIRLILGEKQNPEDRDKRKLKPAATLSLLIEMRL